MFSLFARRKDKAIVAPKLKSRSAGDKLPVNRVSLEDLAPDLPRFLGQAAYLQLSNYETLSGAIAMAPSVTDKVALARASELSLAKLRGLLAEIERGGDEPDALMEHFAAPIDRFRSTKRGADWHETVIINYITAGMLTDFFVALAGGLAPAPRERIIEALTANDPSVITTEVLRRAIEQHPELASRLALWSRSLVGDTLLIARSVLAVPGRVAPDEARLEPVFTELIAEHTRRMDALGLTA